jgi:exonuclease SbcD
MRFVHLSDLHLGKSFYGYDLYEDQAWMLDKVVETVQRTAPDFMIIAGDIYDRSVPSVEAIGLFDTFLKAAVGARPGLQIVIIPGNHDSAGRLAFGSSFLAGAGVRIVAAAPGLLGAASPVDATSAPGEGQLVASQATKDIGVATAAPVERQIGAAMDRQLGAPALVFERGRPGALAVWALPYLSRNALADAVAAIRPFMTRYFVNILAAHCFAAGGFTGDTETAFVGAAEQVDTSLFAGFDHVALGHLHSPQSPAPRVWYSGSPMAYSVSEAERPKGLLLVDLGDAEGKSKIGPAGATAKKDKAQTAAAAPAGAVASAGATASAGAAELDFSAPKVEFIEIQPLRKIRRLSGMFEELMASPLPEAERDCYVEIILGDAETILDARERLRALYPRVLNVRYPVFEAFYGSGGAFASGEALGARLSGNVDPLKLAKEDFLAFHEEITGALPEDSVIALFEGMAKEAADASRQAGA